MGVPYFRKPPYSGSYRAIPKRSYYGAYGYVKQMKAVAKQLERQDSSEEEEGDFVLEGEGLGFRGLGYRV